MTGGKKFTALKALPWAMLSSALLAGCAKPPPGPAPTLAQNTEPPPAAHGESEWPTTESRAVQANAPVAVVPQEPVNGIYIVVPGDTLYGISRRFGVRVPTLIELNALASPDLIFAGQRLRIEGSAVPATVAARPERSLTIAPLPEPEPDPVVEPIVDPMPAPEAAPVAEETPKADAPPEAAALPEVEDASTVVEAKPQPVAFELRRPAPEMQLAAHTPAAPPRRSGPSFRWPVEGPVLSRFGPQEGVGRNDGINIAAAAGAPVRAAETGVVVYAGNELRGYGNLLLVRHGGGWTSAYAHNQALLVTRGDTVQRGQVIARVGSTGGVSEPQSHFELRQGADAVDPLDYLSPR